MSGRPQLGVILDDPRLLSAARKSDPVAHVALRSCLANMPRASGAKALAQRVRDVHADAELALYGWHYLTHIRSDGLAARAARKIDEKEFGHLRATDGVARAWELTKTALDAAGASRVVLRTPPSFSTGGVSRQRLSAFAAMRRAESIDITWAPEGLWTDVEALAVGTQAGVQVMVGARFDRIDPELAGAWLRIDGELRPSSADQLSFSLENLEAAPTLMFAGPRAYANLRNFAKALEFA